MPDLQLDAVPAAMSRAWRFSANLSFLFPELPFLDRFAAARAAGFKAVEYVCLYDHSPEVLAHAAAAAGVQTVLTNIPHGRWDQGERGIACLPDRRAEFRASITDTIRYCRALSCRRVNCLAGIAPVGADRAQLSATMADNLAFAAPLLADAGIDLVVEPINTNDMPGFLIATAAEALAVLDGAGARNLALQFDVYHEQTMTGDAIGALERHVGRIGHVQVADAPGRNEPGTGTVDFPRLFATLDRLGYGGYVGCEYKPKAGTAEGLSWRQTLAVM